MIGARSSSAAAVAQHGSEAGLLEHGLGLTPARLARLRALLLED